MADFADHLIGTDAASHDGVLTVWHRFRPRSLQGVQKYRSTLGHLVGSEQRFHFGPCLLVAAGFLEERRSLAGLALQGKSEEVFDLFPPLRLHRPSPYEVPGSATPWPYSNLVSPWRGKHREARPSPRRSGRRTRGVQRSARSEEHTSELQSRENLVC